MGVIRMTEREMLDRIALAAAVYSERPDANEEEIDKFLEFLFKVYGYEFLMKDDK